MSTLVEKPISISRTLTTSTGHARAIEDPARAKIVEVLYRQALSAEQITAELKKSGHKKAVTTVRHHLEVLRTAGLVEVVRIEESRGAVTKFYGTSTRLLGFEMPDDFDSTYSKAIASTTIKLEKVLKNLLAMPDKDGKPIKPEAYSHYLAAEILNRAMTNVLEQGALAKPK